MIRYSNEIWFGYAQYLHMFGSAIFSWRCFPNAILSASIAFYISLDAKKWQNYVDSPSAYFSGVSFILGFLLVFRTQLAYNRYWEGRSCMQKLVSKLEDVAVHTKSFVQLNDSEMQDWKFNMGWLLVNYFSLAIADLRAEDEDIETLTERYGLVLTEEEMDEMQGCEYKALSVMSNIVDSWVWCSVNGKVAVEPPIQARTYNTISDVQTAFNGAQKIQTTPFPYPLMQVCGLLLNVYMLSAPLVIASFLQSIIFAPLMSFFSVLGLFALNKTSEELEDPFGTDPNDLPLDTYLNTFRQSIMSIGIMKVDELLEDEKARRNSKNLESQGSVSSVQCNVEKNPHSRQSRRMSAAHLMSRDSFIKILPGDRAPEVLGKEDPKEPADKTFWEYINEGVTHTNKPMISQEYRLLEYLSFYHQS